MLNQFLVTELFAFVLIFSRLGSAMMLLPGFGEAYVTPRARLFLALFFSMMMVNLVKNLPPVPNTPSELVFLIVGEIGVGLFIGALARMLIVAMHVTGTIISFQSSLSSALTNDMTQFRGQDTSLGNLLSMTAVVLLFATDMHHIMIRGLMDSYSLFIPGHFPPLEDFAQHITRTLSSSFRMSLQLAGPHIVIGLILYLGAGMLARLIPNMQIFFILMAPQILLSFFVLMMVVSTIMLWYLDYFREAMGAFLNPGT